MLRNDSHPLSMSVWPLCVKVEGVRFMITRALHPQAGTGRGALLGDEMGLGKTLQALAMCTLFPTSKQTLVIAPLSLLPTWKAQVEHHTSLKAHIYHGASGLKQSLARFDVVLANYEIFSSISSDSATSLEGYHWHLCILDEAHLIRNSKSNRCKRICCLKADNKLALTGSFQPASLRTSPPHLPTHSPLPLTTHACTRSLRHPDSEQA